MRLNDSLWSRLYARGKRSHTSSISRDDLKEIRNTCRNYARLSIRLRLASVSLDSCVVDVLNRFDADLSVCFFCTAPRCRTYTFYRRRKSKRVSKYFGSGQYLVLVQSGFDLTLNHSGSGVRLFGGAPNLSNGCVETTIAPPVHADFATTLPELYVSMCSNR